MKFIIITISRSEMDQQGRGYGRKYLLGVKEWYLDTISDAFKDCRSGTREHNSKNINRGQGPCNGQERINDLVRSI